MPRFLETAEEEMLEAATLYEDQSVGLGEKFLEEVEGCVELLLDRPEIGVPAGDFGKVHSGSFPSTWFMQLKTTTSSLLPSHISAADLDLGPEETAANEING